MAEIKESYYTEEREYGDRGPSATFTVKNRCYICSNCGRKVNPKEKYCTGCNSTLKPSIEVKDKIRREKAVKADYRLCKDIIDEAISDLPDSVGNIKRELINILEKVDRCQKNEIESIWLE